VTAIALFFATASWPETPDGLLHLHRVRALSDAIRQGVMFPRWFPDFSFSYGYPVLNFYAPAFYYPPAVLHLLTGVDVLVATRVTLAATYGLSGLAMLSSTSRSRIGSMTSSDAVPCPSSLPFFGFP
jgi:uncharacterized membrane protein